MKKRKIYSLFLVVVYLITIVSYSIVSQAATVTNHGLFYIKNVATGKYLTVDSYGNVVQQNLNSSEYQRFFIDEAYTGNNIMYYTISPDYNADLRLDIANANDANFANVQVQLQTDYPEAQQFRFIAVAGGAYKIMPRLSSTRVLDVSNASSDNNANIQLYVYRTSNSDQYYDYQSWELISAEKSILLDDLVDSGKHLDWKSQSKYSDELIKGSQNIWNSYKSGVIRKDTLLTINDITIADDNLKKNYSAYVDFPTATMYMVTYHVDGYSDNMKRNTIAHEFGHALGVGHINSLTAIVGLYPSNNNVLTIYDKNSYDIAYGNY